MRIVVELAFVLALVRAARRPASEFTRMTLPCPAACLMEPLRSISRIVLASNSLGWGMLITKITEKITETFQQSLPICFRPPLRELAKAPVWSWTTAKSWKDQVSGKDVAPLALTVYYEPLAAGAKIALRDTDGRLISLRLPGRGPEEGARFQAPTPALSFARLK